MELLLSVPLPVPRAVGPSAPRLALVMPEREASDAELIQRIGDGDRAAFDSLYERYARPVYGFALRRLRDRGQAEDVAQETFASVWRSASSYRPERGPGRRGSTRSRGTRSSTGSASTRGRSRTSRPRPAPRRA